MLAAKLVQLRFGFLGVLPHLVEPLFEDLLRLGVQVVACLEARADELFGVLVGDRRGELRRRARIGDRYEPRVRDRADREAGEVGRDPGLGLVWGRRPGGWGGGPAAIRNPNDDRRRFNARHARIA